MKSNSEKPLPHPCSLPPLDPYLVDAIVDWMVSLKAMQRQPEKTAKLLLLVVLLHRKRQPWPTSPTIMAHCGVSKPTVHLFKSQRQAEGLIEAVVKTEPGKVSQRASVVTRVYLQPCEELDRVVKNAERRIERLTTKPERRRRRDA